MATVLSRVHFRLPLTSSFGVSARIMKIRAEGRERGARLEQLETHEDDRVERHPPGLLRSVFNVLKPDTTFVGDAQSVAEMTQYLVKKGYKPE